MTFSVLRNTVTVLLLPAVFALGACGGGGGGGTAANDRGPSGPGSGTMIDTVVGGEALVTADGSFLRARTSCRGTSCTTTLLGESVTVDFHDYIDPSAIPVPITNRQMRNGVLVGRVAVTEDDIRFDTFGVWGTYNAATAAVGSGRLEGIAVRFAVPVSMGVGSGSNPLTGSASWTGAMTGVRVADSGLGAEVTGDAALTADLAASSLNLAFTNIADRSGVQSSDIRWQGVSMQNGSFNGNGGLQGRFYGPNHEEAGGVFERSGIAGAFSLARQ